MHGRHGHERHHDGVAQRHGEHGPAGRRRGPQHRQPARGGGLAPARGLAVGHGQQQGVRPQRREVDQGPEGLRHEGDDESARQRRQAQGPPEQLARLEEVGAEHRADRRGPDHQGEVPGAGVVRGQVGRREPGLEVERRAGAEQGQAQQQDGEAREDGGADRDRRARHGGERPGAERDPPAAGLGEPREGDGEQGRAQGVHGRGHAGPGGGAGDLGDEEGAEGQGGADAQPTEDLAEGEDADDPPLQGAPVHGGVRRVHDRHPIPLGVLAPGVSEPLGVVRCSA